jgi:sulfoxide reductase heme-binding subunit YedZ
MLAFIKNIPTKKQVSGIKVLAFFICLVPMARLVWLGLADNLSANPIEFLSDQPVFGPYLYC